MLLGKEHIILNACPAYGTDALVRKVNVDRYDDREIIRTNLIESFDLLMEFARKHLLDKFFLENEVNVSLRNILAREMISNTLMHREFTSTYAAKFVIEKDRMYVENASRASKQGSISVQGATRSKPRNFGDFLCYPQSAYVQYASIVCLENHRNSCGWSLRVVKELKSALQRPYCPLVH